jgi:hypothetical protein
MHVCAHTQIHAYIFTHVYTYMYTCLHVYMSTHAHTVLLSLYHRPSPSQTTQEPQTSHSPTFSGNREAICNLKSNTSHLSRLSPISWQPRPWKEAKELNCIASDSKSKREAVVIWSTKWDSQEGETTSVWLSNSLAWCSSSSCWLL